jgi:hypothetical protein
VLYSLSGKLTVTTPSLAKRESAGFPKTIKVFFLFWAQPPPESSKRAEQEEEFIVTATFRTLKFNIYRLDFRKPKSKYKGP